MEKYNMKNPSVKRILQEVKEMQSNPSDDFMDFLLRRTFLNGDLQLVDQPKLNSKGVFVRGPAETLILKCVVMLGFVFYQIADAKAGEKATFVRI